MFTSQLGFRPSMYFTQVSALREVEPRALDSFQQFHVSEPIWSRGPESWGSLLDTAMLLV